MNRDHGNCASEEADADGRTVGRTRRTDGCLMSCSMRGTPRENSTRKKALSKRHPLTSHYYTTEEYLAISLIDRLTLALPFLLHFISLVLVSTVCSSTAFIIVLFSLRTPSSPPLLLVVVVGIARPLLDAVPRPRPQPLPRPPFAVL